MQSALKLICCDLDNTLWPVDPVLQRAERAVATWMAQHYPALAVRLGMEDQRAVRLALAQSRPDRAHDLSWLRTESIARAAVTIGLPHDVGAAAFAVFMAERNLVIPYDEVPTALKRLARRFRLATLSNGNANMQLIALGAAFEFHLNAETIGAAKPHRQAFAAVFERAGCHAEQLLYVGDDPHLDVMGAAAAGCRTAWLNRDAALAWQADWPRPDHTVSNLAELADLLGCDELE